MITCEILDIRSFLIGFPPAVSDERSFSVLCDVSSLEVQSNAGVVIHRSGVSSERREICDARLQRGGRVEGKRMDLVG